MLDRRQFLVVAAAAAVAPTLPTVASTPSASVQSMVFDIETFYDVGKTDVIGVALVDENGKAQTFQFTDGRLSEEDRKRWKAAFG